MKHYTVQIKKGSTEMDFTVENVKSKLFELQDLEYKAFHSRLMPTISPETIIGVRTPALRKFAKEMAKYDASLLKGMPTDKKTMNQSNSSWSNIEASVLRVQQLMNTLGNMPGLQLMSKDAQAQIDGANRALEEYQQKIQAIRDSKGYKELVENAIDAKKNAIAVLTVSDNILNHKQMTPKEREQSLNNMITFALEMAE